VVRGRKGEYRKEIAEFQKKGFQRLKVDGEYYAIDEVPALDKKFKHDIDVVVDRIVVRADIAARLSESFETALEMAEGIAIIEFADLAEGEAAPRRITLSSKFACPISGFTIPEIEPRLFSFNSPTGACPACAGIGSEMRIDPGLVVPNGEVSLKRGAIAPWAKSTSPYYGQTLDALAKHFGFSVASKWSALPQNVRDVILYGSKGDKIRMAYNDGLRSYEVNKPFEGVVTNLERRYKETESDWAREEIGRFMGETPCEACGGKRLKPEALAVKIAAYDIGDATALSVKDAHEWFGALSKKLTKKQNEIAGRILKEIRERLTFLVDVGLEYLTLARASGTLSGGESQRIRLASQIGSGLTGVLYVLDEPSIGLHQRDNERLLATLKRLRDLGNTVIVVEHDEDAILQADYVFDIGPGAGHPRRRDRGRGHAPRDPGEPEIAHRQVPHRRDEREGAGQAPQADPKRMIKLAGARGNNLKDVTAEIPLGTFTCITGVSGGGKSTLVVDTLYKAVARKLNGALEHPAPFDRIEGLEHLDKVIDIDQSPSAAPRARTRPPMWARSRRSANGMPACPRPRRVATAPAASRST
jgi:excinuclease ABC subunit A